MQLFYWNPDLQSLQLRDCYVSGTWRVVLCRDPWIVVIPGVVCGDSRQCSRWNFARLGICTPCKLKNPISFWFLGFCEFYAACAEAVGQIDLFYDTGTHYGKNCWVYGEVLWLSARSPSEYAGKRLKMAVSKRLANHHRAAGKISALYIQTSSDHIMQKIPKASRSSVPS